MIRNSSSSRVFLFSLWFAFPRSARHTSHYFRGQSASSPGKKDTSTSSLVTQLSPLSSHFSAASAPSFAKRDYSNLVPESLGGEEGEKNLLPMVTIKINCFSICHVIQLFRY